MAERLCTEPGCDRRHLARGLCKKHYKRHHEGSRRRRELVCSRCGITFLGSDEGKSPNRYCSTTCQAEAKSERYRRPRPAPRPHDDRRTCPSCNRKFRADRPFRKAGRIYCSADCVPGFGIPKARSVIIPCRECGLGFTHVVSTVAPRYCRSCVRLRGRRSRAQARVTGREHNKTWALPDNYRKKARRLGVAYEPINRRRVFDRDRWQCQLCHKRVNPKLKSPHPRSASLDHIIPMNEVDLGPHLLSNVQLAHLVCNTAKGRAARSEQLRLIG